VIGDPLIESRAVELGEHTVVFETYRADVDPAPLFRGLPELLAEESGSAWVRFFAAARRGLYALLTDDVIGAERARAAAVAAGTRPARPTPRRSTGRCRRVSPDRPGIARSSLARL
jgi:hypothetical protein